MRFGRYFNMLTLTTLILMNMIPASAQSPPTLADFWEGRARWVLDVPDVGLPVGESDTIIREDGRWWSYLHASDQSAGIVDQCGQPVEFPGCLTLWESTDAGQSFDLVAPVCLMSCQTCPCDDDRDHITAQQYPRVTVADGTFYMAYEWHAQTILRRSPDGITWSDWSFLRTPGGTWPLDFAPCEAVERIGEHPHIRGQADGCIVGAPPGIYIEGDTLYVFVSAGSAPAHMRCYKGDKDAPLTDLTRCDTDPLFGGAREYGPLDQFGAAAHDYFDFRYVSSAEVLKVGDRYYMAYEGIRGPDELERGMDTQFGLGFARSLTDQIDGEWERYPDNPVLFDMGFNYGVGHADLLIVDGETIMITATDDNQSRGRYRLVWNEDDE